MCLKDKEQIKVWASSVQLIVGIYIILNYYNLWMQVTNSSFCCQKVNVYDSVAPQTSGFKAKPYLYLQVLSVLYPPAVTSVPYFKMSLCLEQWLSTFLVLQPSLSYLESTYVVMNPNYKLIVFATS